MLRHESVRKRVWAAGVLAGFCLGLAGAQEPWPEMKRECRPHAYWWWMGSAVDTANLSRELQRYHDAGMGGVHIIPIYGAKGYEERYIPYLSPRWMEMLDHAVREGKRLDLNVDMTTGTGWCFGGPKVTADEACAILSTEVRPLKAGEEPKTKIKNPSLSFARGPKGDVISLLDNKGWKAPSEGWTLVAATTKTGPAVKRAAPGGAGYMLNLFYPKAMTNYLAWFDASFAAYSGEKPRAMYHDSYEYQSNWSPDFLAQFEKRRGYALTPELALLFDTERMDDRARRVRCDYRETLSDLMVEESLATWAVWCRAKGIKTRNQAHGSPGNLLDLYGVADIPETEMFDKDRSKLVSKFASSAAHVLGKPLVASESGTWLREHFTETLGDYKGMLDDLFLSGVNHVIYHGTCYSPDEVAWPGWLFYASYEMNPRNSVWADAPSLNRYVSRCQSVLQDGKPDTDVLLYWPIHDYWRNAKGLALHMGVHQRQWLEGQPVGKLAEALWNQGYSFDYLSDRQLAKLKMEGGRVVAPGGAYAAIVIPALETMPVESFERLAQLASCGAQVIFDANLVKDVPGLGALDEKRTRLKRAVNNAIKQVRIASALTALPEAGIKPERLMGEAKLSFVRRAHASGTYYFLVNETTNLYSGWVALSRPAERITILDPMSGSSGVGLARKNAAGETEVYVQLNPEETLILKTERTLAPAHPALKPWVWYSPGASVPLHGRWDVTFTRGGPVLPKAYSTESLASWTTQGDEETKRFAGTACYRLAFDAPEDYRGGCFLDLGVVCQSARITVNGKLLGTPFISPYRVFVPELKATGNALEVEVTNVSANRIRDLDRRKVQWKNFHDINFVNIRYKPFDASDWPLYDSGLLGPVTLIKAEKIL